MAGASRCGSASVVRPFRVVNQFKLKPRIVRLRAIPALKSPGFQITVPPKLAARSKLVVATSGSRTPGGAHAEPGGRVALTFAHFVAPIYPPDSDQQGTVRLAVFVAPSGKVARVKVLRSSGSPQLNRAAIAAARQWRFVPFKRALDESIWSVVNLHFIQPRRTLGVPFVIMHYREVARQINAEVKQRGYAPLNMLKVWKRLRRFINALSGNSGRDARGGRSLEAELAGLGRAQSVRFVGFLSHGLQHTNPTLARRRRRSGTGRSRWQVYAVKQQRGFSEWMVEATPRGALRRIEAAFHCQVATCPR